MPSWVALRSKNTTKGPKRLLKSAWEDVWTVQCNNDCARRGPGIVPTPVSCVGLLRGRKYPLLCKECQVIGVSCWEELLWRTGFCEFGPLRTGCVFGSRQGAFCRVPHTQVLELIECALSGSTHTAVRCRSYLSAGPGGVQTHTDPLTKVSIYS